MIVIDFSEEIIKLDIVDLDYILSPYCGDCQTLIVNKSSEKKLYLLREQTIGDENYSDVVLGISKDIKEIKSKMREYVEDNEQYPYFYRLVGDIDRKECLLRGSLSGFESIEKGKRLKVEYKTYKAKTELGDMFLVDTLISVFEDESMYDDASSFAFFEEKEARKFIDETFKDKLEQEVFEY